MAADTFETSYEKFIELEREFVRMSEMRDVFGDTHGNLSWKIDDDHVLIKPSGISFDKITRRDICAINVRTGEDDVHTGRRPSVDLRHHLKIYQYCPEVRAICHSHSPYVTAFAATRRTVPCILTEQADYFGGEINCVAHAIDPDDWSIDVWTKLLAIDRIRAVLLASHGALTFGIGDNPAAEAVDLAAALERVCHKTYLAMSLAAGEFKLHSLWDRQITEWHDRYVNRYGQRKDDDV